ncbi:MAG: hypothetical protein MZU79_09130 [Anaerotruncus sp.]|nr:hypothetical protein [Anaerotruncus sp.]
MTHIRGLDRTGIASSGAGLALAAPAAPAGRGLSCLSLELEGTLTP